MDLHHPILREFPEYREVIRRLKGSSEHFRNVFTEYHRLDDEIYRIEEDIEFATDQEIEELKMRRAKLKDYIYHLIRHAQPAPPVVESAAVVAPFAAFGLQAGASPA
ncbi:MAG TPA: YdcH family protein [Verrucomicrobiae bacterium]|nr:YdcH family protein [Verrucomicrobiae bacterium]